MTGKTVYVAYLDTGGISYSAAEYVAVASTVRAAKEAVYRLWSENPGRGAHPEITGPETLGEYYGIRVWPVTLDGTAVRVD